MKSFPLALTGKHFVIVFLSFTASVILAAIFIWKARKVYHHYVTWKYDKNDWTAPRDIRWLAREESDYDSDIEYITSISSSKSDLSSIGCTTPIDNYTLLEDCTEIVLDKQRKESGYLEHELLEDATSRLAEKLDVSRCAVEGQVKFSIRYLKASKMLVIRLIEAFNLLGINAEESTSPYFKLKLWRYDGMLHPVDARRHSQHFYKKIIDWEAHSNIVRGIKSPQFNEIFECYCDDPHLYTVTLTAMSYDRYSRHAVLGETQVMLSSIDIVKDTVLLKDLDAIVQESGGDILISLNYLPTAERLYVTIIKARNLRATEASPTISAYVRVVMYHHGKKVKKRKTTIKIKDPNPIYNESLAFDLPNEEFDNVRLVVSVLNDDADSEDRRSSLIGSLSLGASSSGSQLLHWTEMQKSLRRPVAQWHSLKQLKCT